MPKAPFTPPDLPAGIDCGPLVKEIAAARTELAKLDTELKHIPNPSELGRSLTAKEALVSSQIEGTIATLNEVFVFEVEKEAKSQDRFDELKEVNNYRRAVDSGVSRIEQVGGISENVIKELHAILLRSGRGSTKTPGEYRSIQAYIGKPGASIEEATYVPPPPGEITRLMSNLERYLSLEHDTDPLVQIGIAHYQFEAIHPFLDGNGRIGRLLISLFLHKRGFLAHPLIYISSFFEEHRREYYDLLRGVSETGNWHEWLAFFLRGLAIQAAETRKEAEEISNLYRTLRGDIISLHSIYAHQFLDAIFAQPVFSATTLYPVSGLRNRQTLLNLIGKFQKAGIIRDVTPGRQRKKIYIFDQLMDLLER